MQAPIIYITPYKKLLKDRKILPIYISILLYSFGITIFASLYSVYFIETGGTSSLLGISNAFMFLIAVIVSTPAGIFADRVGRKP